MELTPVDAVQLVKKYKPNSPIRWNGSWLISQCIIDDFEPHHSNDDHNPSAGINIVNGMYNCFRLLRSCYIIQAFMSHHRQRIQV